MVAGRSRHQRCRINDGRAIHPSVAGHDRIADAAVVGVRDADGQEIPKAFVVPRPDADLDAAEVTAFVAQRVAAYKKVRAVEFVDAIPRSPSGKILRRELRARDATA